MKQLNFISGETAPINFPQGVSVFLAQKNSINLIIKTNIVSDEEIKAFCYGNTELSLQIYDKKILKSKQNGMSLALSIENFIDKRIVICNLKLCIPSFKLEKPVEKNKGYSLNLILINNDNTVVISREIGTSFEFSKSLYEVYITNGIKIKNIEQIYFTNFAVNNLLKHNSINDIINKFTVSTYKRISSRE